MSVASKQCHIVLGMRPKQGRGLVLPPPLFEIAFRLFNCEWCHHYGVVVLVVIGVDGALTAKLTRLATFVLPL